MTCWLTKKQVRFLPGHDRQAEEYHPACARKWLISFHDTALLCVLCGAGLGKQRYKQALSVISGKAPKPINFLCQIGQRKDIPILGQDGVVR